MLPASRSSRDSAPGGDDLVVATVTVEGNEEASNEQRTSLLARVLGRLGSDADIAVLPGGFYSTPRRASTLYGYAAGQVRRAISGPTVVCLGIYGRGDVDQLAVGLSRKGVVAVGRKFYPAEGEGSRIELASSHLELEEGHERLIRVKGRTAYLAVCYDGFGIKKEGLANPGVDLVLDLVYGFYRPGDGYSGNVYFARDGFAGASKQWQCPVFGTATFFNRPIPEAWPTGVRWNRGDESTQRWHYEYNAIGPTDTFREHGDHESALIRLFRI
jgi:hypothetical protein